MSTNPLTILYGSATGNAEGIAKDLEETLTENDHAKLPPPFDSVICKELDQFKKVGVGKAWNSAPGGPDAAAAAAASTTAAKKHGLIVVASTTGNGDPPENANRFARFVKKQVAANGTDFQHVSFAVLGLGDTNYDQFCATGKSIDKSLNALGGHRAKPLSCADEATGLEDVVEPWIETVVQDLAKACLEGETKAETEAETGAEVKAEEKPKEEAKTDESAAASTTTSPTTTAAPATTSPTPSSPPPDHSDAPLYILYGSATGNAESIAKDLASTYENLSLIHI